MKLPRWNRYKPGHDFVSFDQAPRGVQSEVLYLAAEDGGRSRGTLYAKGTERTVLCLMHPRADMTRHYAAPYILERGFAYFCQESRWPGTDVATLHEGLILDVAAAVVTLRGRGFEKIVLLGNSGAGSLYCFYAAQAATFPPNRLTETAAGDPFDLNAFEMPAPDGIIFLGAHIGAGKILQSELDPSVVDESDPFSCAAKLDMFNPANGFREPPTESRYTAEFLDGYRRAQADRVARIDAIARQHISTQRRYRDIVESLSFDGLSSAEQRLVMTRAVQGPVMRIFRVDANPAAVDLTIDPSARSYGSLMSRRPDLSNYAEPGSKVLTPRAWLSSWSGHSSKAAILDNIPKVDIPTFVLFYSADNAIHPSHSQSIFTASPARDKSLAAVEADHFGLGPDGTDIGARREASNLIADWMADRFPMGG